MKQIYPKLDIEKSLERVGNQLREMAYHKWVDNAKVEDARLPLRDIKKAREYYTKYPHTIHIFNPQR